MNCSVMNLMFSLCKGVQFMSRSIVKGHHEGTNSGSTFNVKLMIIKKDG